MTTNDKDEVLAIVRASNGRRVLGLGCLYLLGVFLVYIAFAQPPSLPAQVFLLVVGGAALWLADKMRRATDSVIELTADMLRDADGTVIARVEDITGMDRGFFAFKPSNGFLLRTCASDRRVWRPGLWWRLGNRIGIGGMTPGHQTKFMAEVLSTLMAKKDPLP